MAWTKEQVLLLTLWDDRERVDDLYWKLDALQGCVYSVMPEKKADEISKRLDEMKEELRYKILKEILNEHNFEEESDLFKAVRPLLK